MTAPTLQNVPTEAKNSAPVTQVMAAYGAWQAGSLSWEQFTDLVTGYLAVTRSRVAILADAAVCAALRAAGLTEAVPVGIVPGDLSQRDTESLDTVTEDDDSAPMRLERLIRATCEQYGRDAAIDAMSDQGIDTWRWVTPDPEACKYCRDRNGKEYDITVRFRDHPNCECYPQPIV